MPSYHLRAATSRLTGAAGTAQHSTANTAAATRLRQLRRTDRALDSGTASRSWRTQCAAAAESAAPVPPPAGQAAGAFDALGCDDRVTGNLKALGIREPTEVQAAAIPAILRRGNVAVQCYTGSGKTLAYLLPVLGLAIQAAEAEALALAEAGRQHEAGAIHALVVAPSRELAMQIVRVAQALLPTEARGCVQQCIGGANPARQVEALKQNKPLLVVGTPGRLVELMKGGKLGLHGCGLLVLDEADQLLAPQFREDMTHLTTHCGKRMKPARQTILVSATLTTKVLAAAQTWCPDAEPIFVGAQPTPAPAGAPASLASGPAAAAPEWGWAGGGEPTEAAQRGSAGGVGTAGAVPSMPPGLEHAYVLTTRRDRVDTVRRCIHALEIQQALVFMNFQQSLADTAAKLAARQGFPTAYLHGDMTKVQRQAVLRQFRRGDFRALVVSDVMARGLDIPACDAVINLELPSDAAHYAHRAGRTGRAGQYGTVVSIAEPRERHVIAKLSRALGVPIALANMGEGRLWLADDEAQALESGGVSSGV